MSNVPQSIFEKIGPGISVEQPPVRINILIIGSSGTGKSSFLKCFHSVDPNNNEPPEQTFKITALPPRKILAGNGVSANIHFWDTRGYGDNLLVSESIRPILDHIENNFNTHDVVHCVFFLLVPDRLQEYEKSLMRELNRMTLVVPLIGKADSMDPRQKVAFQKKVL